MPPKTALIDYSKCVPEKCEQGVCRAVEACPRNLLKQDAPYEKPDPASIACLGCAFCVQACPVGAVLMM